MFHAFFTTCLDIQEQNTCFYGCLNLSLYIFIRKIISMAYRFYYILFHFTYNGVSLLTFWLNRYPCRRVFWNLLILNLRNILQHGLDQNANVMYAVLIMVKTKSLSSQLKTFSCFNVNPLLYNVLLLLLLLLLAFLL